MSSIRVLIADDHGIVREGLRTLVGSSPDMEVVGEAADGATAVQVAFSTSPDVILMDLVMPEMDGIDAIQTIKAKNPEVNILVLTSFSGDDMVFPAIKSGAAGYLLKDAPPSGILEAIRAVCRGESSLHPSIAVKLVRELREPPDLPPTSNPLTEREVEVLKLVAQGMSNQEIADHLFISEGTVGTHMRNILGKLHLANRTQAALYALRKGLASLED